jgi:hypothetical protein
MKKIIFLILVLGLAFSLSACSNKNEGLTLKNGSSEELESFSGSLKDLIARGKDLKCTYSVSGIPGQGQMSGTTYISGEKSFNQSKISGTDLNMETNILIDGEYMYTWSNMTDKGTKMNMEKIKEMELESENDGDYEEFTQNYDEEYDYKCTSWKKDNSKFQAPANIEFMDLTTMMTGMTGSLDSGATNDGLGDMCAMCDIVPNEEDKKECLANLGCE